MYSETSIHCWWRKGLRSPRTLLLVTHSSQVMPIVLQENDWQSGTHPHALCKAKNGQVNTILIEHPGQGATISVPCEKYVWCTSLSLSSNYIMSSHYCYQALNSLHIETPYTNYLRYLEQKCITYGEICTFEMLLAYTSTKPFTNWVKLKF